MRFFIFGILFFFLLPVFACHKQKWIHTSNGISYQLFSLDTSKAKPIYGDRIWMHLRKYSDENKEIFNTNIFETTSGVELEFKQSTNANDVIQFFSLLGKGDSIKLKVPAHLLDSSIHRRNKKYTFIMTLVDFKTKSAYETEKINQAQVQQALDSTAIENYLQRNLLKNFVVDSSGIWYAINNTENGDSIKKGMLIKIHYKGYLLNNLVFDNSYERKTPLQFTVGAKQVIDGLDIGIQHFRIGDKGTLIIPSRLAYGDRSVGAIPSNSVLVFEVEILK